MSDVIETGSMRRTPDANKPRAEAIGQKRRIDRSEDELELGHFVGDTQRKPGPDKTASGHRRKESVAASEPGEVVGPKRRHVDTPDVKTHRDKTDNALQIAAPLVVDEEQPTRRPRARLRRRPVTDGTTDWGRISALALLCALLVVLTGATFLLMPRYDPLGEPLIADPAFDAGLVDWRQAGLISQDLDDPDEVVLESISSTARTYLARDLDLPPGDTLLILGTRVKGDEVVTGTEPWDGARMYLAQLDADGQPNWEDNHNVFNLNGTTDIRNYRRAFTIPAEIQTTRLGIELKNATGRLTVSQLELSVVAYKTSYQIAVGCLLLAWSALVLYIAIKTFGGIDSVRIRLCLGVLCALSVVALMLPGGVHDIGTQGIAAQFGISEIGVDSIGHGVMFTALAFLVRLGRPFDPLWLHVGAWLLIAVASEVLQLFTVGRDPSFDDLWLDGVGVLLGLALAEITLRMRRSSAA